MLRTVRARLTYANVMATIAVFVALGGSSYAAIVVTGKNVKNSSLTGKDVKNSSLASADVRNRSLLALDFKAGQLPAGPTGPQGPAGPQGTQGEQGTAGRSALSTLQSGETVRGVVRIDTYVHEVDAAAKKTRLAAVSLPMPAPVPLSDANVVVDETSDEAGNQCNGSNASPSAPAGLVCIYPNASPTNVQADSPFGAGMFPASPLGFRVGIAAAAVGRTAFDATWAYTAP